MSHVPGARVEAITATLKRASAMKQRNDVGPQPPTGWPLWTWTAVIMVVAVAAGGAITYRSITKAAARDALVNAVSAKPNPT